MPAMEQSRKNCKHNLAVEALRSTGHLRLAAFGYSMLPTLWPGDLLLIEKVSMDRVQPGDVIFFARHDRFFIHRTLRRLQTDSETRLLTRGDAMPDPDVPVRSHELLGRVVSVKRGPRDVAVPDWSLTRRAAGLLLVYYASLRTLALHWHTWRSQHAQNSRASTL